MFQSFPQAFQMGMDNWPRRGLAKHTRWVLNGPAGRRVAQYIEGVTMSAQKVKTNEALIDLIDQLKVQSRNTGAALWRDVALRLEKSRSNWSQPNLSRLSRHAADEKFVLIPGKLLGSGEVSGKQTVAAFSFSAQAREKIEAAGGKTMTIAELMDKNPKGTGVFILG